MATNFKWKNLYNRALIDFAEIWQGCGGLWELLIVEFASRYVMGLKNS